MEDVEREKVVAWIEECEAFEELIPGRSWASTAAPYIMIVKFRDGACLIEDVEALLEVYEPFEVQTFAAFRMTILGVAVRCYRLIEEGRDRFQANLRCIMEAAQ